MKYLTRLLKNRLHYKYQFIVNFGRRLAYAGIFLFFTTTISISLFLYAILSIERQQYNEKYFLQLNFSMPSGCGQMIQTGLFTTMDSIIYSNSIIR